MLSDFLNFDGVVREEEVEDVEIKSTFKTLIIPEDAEGEDLSIILEILLKSSIGMTSLVINFDVLLVLFLVWGWNFNIFQCQVGAVVIRRNRLWVIELDSHILIEFPCKSVSISDSENPFVEVNVDADIEILPGVVGRGVIQLFGDFLPLDEETLDDSGILSSWFIDVDGSVTEIIVDIAFSDSIVFDRVFNYCLLEVAGKSQDLSIVLQPRRLDSRNIIINWLLSISVGQ